MLLKSSLQASSLPVYQRSWKLYNQFLLATFPGTKAQLPVCQSILALFIAWLYRLNYAPSTVSTYVSALGYLHKLSGFTDPGKGFVIGQLMKGYGKMGARQDSRLPITPIILHRLLQVAEEFRISPYQIALFKAMCSLAFHAFLRVGEITVSTKKGLPAPLQLHQCSLVFGTSGRADSLKISFLNFKHNYNKAPFSIMIRKQPQSCPVQLMQDYLQLRGASPGCLFLGSTGFPITRTQFCDWLTLAFKFCGLDPKVYKGHSFRIGAASHAAEQGVSDAKIRLLGRWKSNAFLKYIRLPAVNI